MEQILDETARRNMAVIVGLFYQRAPRLGNATAYRNAVTTVTNKLRRYRHLMFNIANEQNSGYWSGCPYSFNPQGIIDMCALVHASDSSRLCGGGGYEESNNEVIGRGSSIDALLFDTDSTASSAGLYDRYADAGVRNKPMVNVEIFGNAVASSGTAGVFNSTQKTNYYDQIADGVARDGLSIFFHNTLYCQGGTSPGGTIHYELGGDGTSGTPGIRWYFERVKQARGL